MSDFLLYLLVSFWLSVGYFTIIIIIIISVIKLVILQIKCCVYIYFWKAYVCKISFTSSQNRFYVFILPLADNTEDIWLFKY